MFSKKRMMRIAIAGAMGFGASTTAGAVVIDAYFGMNFVGSPFYSAELQLTSITYQGDAGTVTTAIPNLPDGVAPPNSPPTYLNGGDGESTRTLGVTVPIDWDMSSLTPPSIKITDITLNVLYGGGIWTAHSDSGYVVGLIPFGFGTELSSLNPAPYGDIYGGGFSGANPAGTFIATSAPTGLESLLGQAFGDFRFAAAAAPVPIPAAVWLFGSGLLGLIGVARHRRTNA